MKESDLKHLPSYKFYDGFKEKNNMPESSKYCEELKKNYPANQKIHKICNLLITNVFYFRDEHSKNGDFLDKHCYDLNYWLHEQLSIVLGGKAHNAKIYSLFKEFQEAWESLIKDELFDNTDYICMPIPELFKIPLIKYMKYFFDYLENYETIKKEITMSGEKPNNYCPYISERVQVYHAFKALCSSVLDNYCKKYVEDYKNCDPKTLLSMPSCKGGATGNILRNNGLMTQNLNLQRSIPNSMIPGLAYIPDLQNVFMQSLPGLMEGGIGSLGLESLLNKFPALSNMINSNAFKHVGLVFSVLIFSIEGEEDVDI
ncbi:variable surface protein Vir4 [Plasmodium vivax Mauritania I]|uniref:Variable surface protein Vir4 n=1 Tax=Plasmodium vivax Mauritania I TaxID=1035515 RepID=A0A0J9TAH4_PLAVI|nr:variable surface protein Vir4 [Plasmodium vivax Mauritania I]